jgi:hypothetical protein
MHEDTTPWPQSLLSSQEPGLNGSPDREFGKEISPVLRKDAVPGGQAAEDTMFRDMLEWETYCADSAHMPLALFEPTDMFAEIDALIGLDSALLPTLELPEAATFSQRRAVSTSRQCANKPVRQTVVPSGNPGLDKYCFVGNWDGEEAAFQAFIEKVESRLRRRNHIEQSSSHVCISSNGYNVC